MVIDEICAGEDTVSKKSASALRTIGEVTEALDVPQHVLRFWEKQFPQLTPVKRRGRRYYGPEDMALLQQIKNLLYKEGYTVKGVQKYLAASAQQDQPDLFEPAVLSISNSTGYLKQPPSVLHLQAVLEKLSAANKQLKDALQ